MNNNKENLKQLLSRFLDRDQVAAAEEDFRLGSKILSSSHAHEPEADVIASIKEQISVELDARKKQTKFRVAIQRLAAAAAIILVGTLVARFLASDNSRLIVPDMAAAEHLLWEDEDITESDHQLTLLITEIEQMEDGVLSAGLGQYNGNNGGDLVDLEMEIDEINIDFWEG